MCNALRPQQSIFNLHSHLKAIHLQVRFALFCKMVVGTTLPWDHKCEVRDKLQWEREMSDVRIWPLDHLTALYPIPLPVPYRPQVWYQMSCFHCSVDCVAPLNSMTGWSWQYLIQGRQFQLKSPMFFHDKAHFQVVFCGFDPEPYGSVITLAGNFQRLHTASLFTTDTSNIVKSAGS